VIGIPLGVLLGGIAWRAYASSLGVVPEADVAWWSLVIAAVVTFTVANAVALVPARSAARTRPAVVLRSE
jgi:ABC-type antimicrobial peptide transport system permease subunit